MSQTVTAKHKVAVARMMINKENPYFSSLIEHIVYRWTKNIPTMAMSKTGVCYMNEKFVDELNPKEVAFCLLHEIAGHYWREHFKRMPNDADHFVWNIAGDLEINDSLIEAGWPMPSIEGVTCDKFGYDKHKTVEYYYDRLTNDPDAEKKLEKFKGKCPICAMEESMGGGQDSEEQDGEGEGGEQDQESGTGGQGKSQGNSKGQQGQQGGCGHERGVMSGRCGSAADGNESGENENGDGRTEAEKNRVRQQVAESMCNHAKQHGNVPGAWLREAEIILEKPKVSWKEKFARCVKNTLNYMPGLMIKTYKKFGRKQAALGYSYGTPVIPSTRNVIPSIIFAIDTSGSMGNDELSKAVSEANGILKNFNSYIDFMSFDCEVAAFEKAFNINDIKKNLKGGGGTSFVPIFEKIKQDKLQPDMVVIVTDGCGPAPDVNPIPKTSVIWVLVGPYTQRPCDWGEFIAVEGEVPKDNRYDY